MLGLNKGVLSQGYQKGKIRDDNMKMILEQWQIIDSALSCVSKESKCTLTKTLVDCAKQIVNLHMNTEIVIDVDYNDGLLKVIKPIKERWNR